MEISGVLVQTLPRDAEALRSRLVAMPGVEVHAISADGGLVVTVETSSSHTMADILNGLQQMHGVLSATLIYHHQEPPGHETQSAESKETPHETQSP